MRLASKQVEVSVRLFAQLRERAGTGELQLELPEGARVADALERLGAVTEGFPLVVAVNREYTEPDRELVAGDELALIPPVSGGEATLVHARVTGDPLDPVAVRARVTDPAAGAVVVFEGVTREVEALEYEAYTEMAEERIALILAEAVQRHGLTAAAAEHRVGSVPLSEPSVVVAVSAGHREAAFTGAREAIDRIKAEAPIWKKEVDGGEGRWVDGQLP
jgi:molybdopterin converting factor subunit 1